MGDSIQIGNVRIGDGQPVFVIGEIGINHNGDVNIARELVEASVRAGVDAVKFQKRTVDVVYTKEELARPRENPFGTTNGDLKHGLEFGAEDYGVIAATAGQNDVLWMASCWDEASVDFMEEFSPPAYKIASASLTDDNLLRYHRRTGRPIIMSTGMSTTDQIDHAVDVLGTDNLLIMHCTSTYPSTPEELNLSCIPVFKERYGVPIGYSGHETGIASAPAVVALGAVAVERHITLDRRMWGSDQSASLEPDEFTQMVSDIRDIEAALGDGVKRVYESEVPIIEKLRRVGG
jgi:N-acetylneuraminate synthase